MWIVHLALSRAVLYAVVVAALYLAQAWLLFPAMLARAARVQLPASTERLEVKTPNGETLAGVLIPSFVGGADDAPTLLGFGGNARRLILTPPGRRRSPGREAPAPWF